MIPRFRAGLLLPSGLALACLSAGCTSYPELRATDWYRQRAAAVRATRGGLMSPRRSAENKAIWVGTVAEGVHEIRWEGSAQALVLTNADVLIAQHPNWHTEVILSYGRGAFPDGRIPRTNEKWAFHASRDSLGRWTILSAFPLDEIQDE